jgi:hypothetical protein
MLPPAKSSVTVVATITRGLGIGPSTAIAGGYRGGLSSEIEASRGHENIFSREISYVLSFTSTVLTLEPIGLAFLKIAEKWRDS